MAEPTSALNFRDLVKRVAQYYGVASYDSGGLPYIPVDDAFNFEESKRIVAEGIRMLVSRPPSNAKWRWMRRNLQVTFDATGGGVNNIDSDAARYLLDASYCGQTAGKIHYIAASAHNTRIEWRDEAFINERRETTTSQTGYPQFVAIVPYQMTGPALAASRRWEMILFPTPHTTETVFFPHLMQFDRFQMEGGTATGASTTSITDSSRTEPDDFFNTWVVRIISGTGKLSSATVTDYTGSTGAFTVADWLDQEGAPAGTDPVTGSLYLVEPATNMLQTPFVLDEAVREACLAKAEMEAEDAELGTRHITYFNDVALPGAWDLDGNSAPRLLGPWSNGPRRAYRRVRENITYNTL